MIKIAIASTDQVHVNQHFGWCERFYIYEIDANGYRLVDEVDASQKHEEEVEKLVYKISCIEGCDIVYVTQIGPKAANMVQKVGIYPMRASGEEEKIDSVLSSLQRMINGNAPLWLKRIIMQKAQS